MSGLDPSNDEVYDLYVPDDLVDPYNTSTWGGAGVPEVAVEVGVDLISRCWSDEMMLSELLSEYEISEMKKSTNQIDNNLLNKIIYDIPNVTKQLMLVERDKDVLKDGQIRKFITESYICSAGSTANSVVEWRNNCVIMLNAGIFPLLSTLFEIMAALAVEPETQDVSGDGLDRVVIHNLKMLVTSISSLFIGSGIGLPHPSASTRNCDEVVSESVLLDVRKNISSNDYQIISNLYVLIRGFTVHISGQKLIIMLHVVLATVCGTVDIKPSTWSNSKQYSERWVGDGVVESYIESIQQSGETCSRLSFLSKGLLLSYYYHILERILKSHCDCEVISEDTLADDPPSKFKGIPLPIREALVVFAMSISNNLEKRKDGSLKEKQINLTGTDVEIPDRPDISLSPEYPPANDCFMQPTEGYHKMGSPPPGMWHALQDPSYVRSENIAPDNPKEEIYRKLVQILPGLVVRLFRLFLSSLPAEGEQKKSTEGDSEHQTNPSNKHRNGDVFVKCVSGFLIYIIKLFSTCSPVKSEVVLQHMGDSNGLLLLLKFLHQERIIPVPDHSNDPDNTSPDLYPPLPNEVLPFPSSLSLCCKCATADGPATCDARNLVCNLSFFFFFNCLLLINKSSKIINYSSHVLQSFI